MEATSAASITFTKQQLKLLSVALLTEQEVSRNAIDACDGEDENGPIWRAELRELEQLSSTIADALAQLG
jgi:hypothetical protein